MIICAPVLSLPPCQQITATKFRRSCCDEATVRKKIDPGGRNGDRRYRMRLHVIGAGQPFDANGGC
jgi:hypothetical protein